MPRRKKKDWEPGEACSQAFERIERTAERAACVLWGGRPGQALATDARLTRAAMIYFLLRIDPADIKDFYFSPGGIASLDYKPFPEILPASPGVLFDLMVGAAE